MLLRNAIAIQRLSLHGRMDQGATSKPPTQSAPLHVWARRLWVAIPFRTALGANQEHA